MQFLDNDSNEWMRKAAEEYPVKPFGMNWEAIAGELQDEPPEKGHAGYVLMRYAAMIVFFMLLSLVCNKYLRMDFSNRYAGTGKVADKSYDTADPVLEKTTGQSVNNKATVRKERGWASGNGIPDNTLLKREQGDAFAEEQVMGQPVLTDKSKIAYITSVPDWRKNVSGADVFSQTVPPSHLLKQEGALMASISSAATQDQKAKKSIVEKRRLYAGFLLGPDISSVKFQKTEGLGYNLGILLGYRLSPKWQLESGVLLNRKEYYSGGEYFNADRAYLPSHAYITKVNGYCTMFEIPVNVRYNISQKKQSNWFAVAGLSSYLMNKEDYNYTYKRYNVEYKGNKEYNHLSKEWLTVVNASIGYEKLITEKIQIRVEPYLKLPLRGMGTGKLPISSTGMNIGISHPIK